MKESGRADRGLLLVSGLLCSLGLMIGFGEVRAQESIFDPENVDFREEEEIRRGGEEEEGKEEPASTGPGGVQRTRWRVDFEAGGLVEIPGGERPRDPHEFAGSLGMELRHEISDFTDLVLDGRFRYWAGAEQGFQNWRTHFEPRLERAYLIHRRGKWSFGIGQMRNSWGSTDIVRPGDVIDPVDMRDPLSGDGLGAAIGQFSANAGYSGGKWSLRGVVVPFFQGNQISLFGRDTALATQRNPVVAEQLPFLLLAEELLDPSVVHYQQSLFQSTTRPKDLPKNMSVGLRGTMTVGGADLGAGAFLGWDRTPWVELDEDMGALLTLLAEDGEVFEDYDFTGFLQRNPEAFQLSQRISAKAEAGETIFGSEYRRRTTLLVDFARYFGRIGVRGDLAFSPRRVFYTREFEPRVRSSAFGALGLSFEELIDGERPLALILEGFWLHPFRPGSAIHEALVPGEEGGSEEDQLLIFDDGYYGAAFAGNWRTPWLRMDLEAGGIFTISPGDLVGRVGATFRISEAYYLRTGANFFLGPDPEERLTIGGLWSHNDKAYLFFGGEF